MAAADDLRRCSAFVESACASLGRGAPADLDAACGPLASAIQDFAALRASLGSAQGDSAALAEAWRLRRMVRRAAALLENAHSYHEKWTLRLSAQTTGYGPDGAPAAFAHTGRVCLEG